MRVCTMKNICNGIYFTREYKFLNNFYETCVEFKRKGQPFVATSSEAAYQSFKTTDLKVARDICAMRPDIAARVGRSLNLRPDWEDIKINVMYHVVYSKFKNVRLQSALFNLFDTAPRDFRGIIYKNAHGDQFWGVDKSGNGENHLGIVLNDVYVKLKTAELIQNFRIWDHYES